MYMYFFVGRTKFSLGKEWKLMKELGSGTYGVVNLYIHAKTKQELAVKQLKQGRQDDSMVGKINLFGWY